MTQSLKHKKVSNINAQKDQSSGPIYIKRRDRAIFFTSKAQNHRCWKEREKNKNQQFRFEKEKKCGAIELAIQCYFFSMCVWVGRFLAIYLGIVELAFGTI